MSLSEGTNWDALYLRLKFSPLGTDFTPERFLATPVRTIFWLLEQITEYDMQRANVAAVSTAHLNNQLMWALYGFGGGKGPKPKATIQDFLPFPEAGKEKPNVVATGPTAETRAALRHALASGELPYDIFLTLWRGPQQ